MSMRLDAAVLAEGAAPDSRGNLTLVAFNPAALVAEQFPTAFTLTYVVLVEDEGEPVVITGHPATTRVTVTGPDGEVLFFAEQLQVVPERPHPNLPNRLQLVSQIPFTAAKAGNYTFTAAITVTDPSTGNADRLEASRPIRVVEGASLRQGSA